MSDTGEMVQTDAEAAIERAYHVENDPEKANRLYQRLIGSTDREGEVSPEPVVEVPDQGQAEAPAEDVGPSPSDVDPGMGGTGMDEYVSIDSLTQNEQDAAYDDVMSLSDPDTARGILEAEWPGAEYERNREFSDAALRAVSGSDKALRVLEITGIANHPDLVRWIVSVGRLMATTPGDPTSITTHKIGATTMDSTMTGNVQAQIEALEEQIERATALNDTEKSNALYARQQGLYRLLPGGSDPAVGEGGRTL